LLVSDTPARATLNAGWVKVSIPSIIDHEVIVIE
jgi:hypothetical protein